MKLMNDFFSYSLQSRWSRFIPLCLLLIFQSAIASEDNPPNILVIMTDDMAPFDVSAIHRGLGAVRTKHIDRIADEGLLISDYYAQPSCTAGRAAFLKHNQQVLLHLGQHRNNAPVEVLFGKSRKKNRVAPTSSSSV